MSSRVVAVVLVMLLFLTVALAAIARAALPADRAAFWRGVAQCETGGRWAGLGSTYQGGLGIYASTWDWWARELGLWRRYPDAGMAPPIVQMRVAEWGWRVHGGYWGCLQ